jgi:predicted ABC-type ATPase
MGVKSNQKVPIFKLVRGKKGGRPFTQKFWVTPEEAKEIRAKGKITTADKYKVNGKYNKDRSQLHKRIIGNVKNKCPKPLPGEKPTAILLLGGAASGKSTVVNKVLIPELGSEFGTINADDIKDDLPEFRQGMERDVLTAANAVHTESSDLGKIVTRQVINEGRNFIYDGVLGNPEKAKKLIADLRAKGYNIKLVGVDVPAEEAMTRANKRALGDGKGKKGSGRYVPDKILAEGHKGSAETFEKIKDLVDDVSLYDNNVPQGDDPIAVIEGGKVLSEDKYRKFKNKASLTVSAVVDRSGFKEKLRKSFDALGIDELSKSDPGLQDKNNLSVTSDMYKGSDIYSGLYGFELQKGEDTFSDKPKLKEEEPEKPQHPTPEDMHEMEMKSKALKQEVAAKMDKKHSYKGMDGQSKRGLKVLLNIQGKSAKEKIEAVMEHFGVSKMGAINILADATNEMSAAGNVSDSKKEDKEIKKSEVEDKFNSINGSVYKSEKPISKSKKDLDDYFESLN